MTSIFKKLELKMEKILKIDKKAEYVWVGEGKDPFK